MAGLEYKGMNLEPMTIMELIDRSIKNHSDRNALGFYNQKPLTYTEMGEKIKRTSAALATEGVRSGDKVAIIGESSPDWTCAYLGIIYLSAVKAIVQYFGGNLNVIAFGGAPLDKEVEAFLIKGRFPYVFGYGLTETSGLACGAPSDKSRGCSCGFPIRHLDVKIVDPEPATGVGEIMIKGPTVMAGYFKNDELTRETLTKDHWLKTGDRGIIRKNGYLYIKGRSKNMFLSTSGENVYPEIIEEKLRMFPVVQEALARQTEGAIEALVYPDPDVLAAKLEGRADKDREQAISEILENIRVTVNKRLPHFYRIKKCVYQTEPFIKNAANKIKRFLHSNRCNTDHRAAN